MVASEWIDWDGGECPVPDGVGTQVKFRDGRREEEWLSSFWTWRHTGEGGDIIAYRTVQ